jgi:hypothetical protein
MGHIDDPQDQIESQYPVEEGSILIPLLTIAAPFIALEPNAAGIAAVMSATTAVADFLLLTGNVQPSSYGTLSSLMIATLPRCSCSGAFSISRKPNLAGCTPTPIDIPVSGAG